MVLAKVNLNEDGIDEVGTMMSEGGLFTDISLKREDRIVDPCLRYLSASVENFVLLSMEERDYVMFAYGGISNNLDACDEFLTKADEGEPVYLSYGIFVPVMTGRGCLPRKL